MKENIKKRYGLGMSISMIIGIVIGSGIFFKTDDILIATNGNVAIGAIALVLGAFCIIFGGISLSALAQKDDSAGGIITYAEMTFNPFFAFLTGFFQMVCYFPALIAIILFVGANYTLLLFPQWNLNIWAVTLFYFVLIFGTNFFSAKITGYFQNFATIVKLLPLIIIGCIGLFFGKPTVLMEESVTLPLIFASSSAIVSVAFSYDGWTIAPSICHEIKNAKKNLTLALCISPLVIMCVYLIYFIGMSSILGPQHIIATGDAHVSEVASMYFGSFANKLIISIIIISVLGTVNGLTLGGTRVPYALAVRNELYGSNQIKKIHPNYGTPSLSILIGALCTLAWLFIHYLSTTIPSLSHLDISSIPIVIMYVIYLIIFIGVIKMYGKKQIQGFFKCVISSIFAIMGATVVIYGALASTMAYTYLIISFTIIMIGVILFLSIKRSNDVKK